MLFLEFDNADYALFLIWALSFLPFIISMFT